MGFFSFGKKKKDVEAIGSNAAASPRTSSSKAATTTTTTAAAAARPNKLVNNSGASASASAGAALVPNPRRFNTHPVPSSRLAKTANVIPNANRSSGENAIVEEMGGEERLLPPRPRSKLFAVAAGAGAGAGSSSSLSSSSSSLAAPIQPFVHPQQHDLSKKGSTNTLNSISSNNNNNAGAANGTTGRRKRGPHDSPKLANLSSASMKPRASSYHAATATTPTTTPSGAVRSIWMQPYQPNGSGYFGHNKYASTGTPGAGGGGGLMARASYANLPAGAPITPIHHQPSPLQGGGGGGPGMMITPDEEFKAYTRTYDLLIAKAHTLAREYHHLPVAKRDREGYERVGKAFAEAARASREQWTMRCALERERMKTEGMGAAMMSVHRLAGTRACEGWEYASMLADAWGVSEEMNVPLDEMPHQPQPHSYGPTMASSVPYPMEEVADVNEFGGYGYGGGGYVHPGYDRTAYAEYVAQQQQQQQQQHHRGYARKRNVSVRTRLDSGVSAAAPSVLESMSTHEDGGQQQQQQQRQQRSYSHSQSHHGHAGRRLSGEMVTTTAAGAATATMGRSSASTGHNGYGYGSGSANLAGVGAGNRHRTASALSHSTSMPVLARKPAADVRAQPNGYHSGGSGDEADTPAASTGSSPASSAASYSANDNNDPPVIVAVPAAAAAAAAVHTTMTTSSPTSPVKMTFPTTTTSPPSPPPKAFPTRTVSPSPLSSSLEPAEPEVKVIKLTKGRRYRAQV
ncbi:hypothetical protein FRC17_009494 [Serendipita sp. 399]|nr:hypothetical protein FRC17_009494 [Serendipita sp. 399]